MDEAELSCDRLLGGALTLLQPKLGHRAGTDAVLLAGTAAIQPGDRVVDLGSASGAVGLMAAHRVADAVFTFVDRDPDLIALCRRNIVANGFEARAVALVADAFTGPSESVNPGLERQSFDLVLTNPPFFGDEERASPVVRRRAAHAMCGGDLKAWLAAAARLLKPRGRLWMVHRADRLDICLAALAPPFGSPVVVPVYPKGGNPATRVLIGAVKDGRAALRLDPPLVLHRPDGGWTEAARRLHEPA